MGGNEPYYTGGIDEESLLPYVLKSLKEKGIKVGITTSGITLIKLLNDNPDYIKLINDVDISLDSPFEIEHNNNRGLDLYKVAIHALDICNNYNIDHSIIMCAMNWNFTKNHAKALLELARKTNSNLRFNLLKPTEANHVADIVPLNQFYDVYKYLLNECDSIDITEPRIKSLIGSDNENRCPCGRTSLRIHSITDEGKIPVSPCVYLHDYKVGNLLDNDLESIIKSDPFMEFRRRNKNPDHIEQCKECKHLNVCGGGCTSMAYYWNYWKSGERNIYTKEPNCIKDADINEKYSNCIQSQDEVSLVHIDYLCTWIGKPKKI